MSESDNSTTLSISLDGTWSAAEFSSMLRSLEDIYNFLIVLNSSLLKSAEARYDFFPIDRRKVRRFATEMAAGHPLSLPRVQYASPGWADVLGAGEAIKQLKEFILGITDRVLSRRSRNLDIRERELALEDLKDKLLHRQHEQRIQLLQSELETAKRRRRFGTSI